MGIVEDLLFIIAAILFFMAFMQWDTHFKKDYPDTGPVKAIMAFVIRLILSGLVIAGIIFILTAFQ